MDNSIGGWDVGLDNLGLAGHGADKDVSPHNIDAKLLTASGVDIRVFLADTGGVDGSGDNVSEKDLLESFLVGDQGVDGGGGEFRESVVGGSENGESGILIGKRFGESGLDDEIDQSREIGIAGSDGGDVSGWDGLDDFVDDVDDAVTGWDISLDDLLSIDSHGGTAVAPVDVGPELSSIEGSDQTVVFQIG